MNELNTESDNTITIFSYESAPSKPISALRGRTATRLSIYPRMLPGLKENALFGGMSRQSDPLLRPYTFIDELVTPFTNHNTIDWFIRGMMLGQFNPFLLA